MAHPVIRYASAALLLLGATTSEAAYFWKDHRENSQWPHPTAMEACEHALPGSIRGQYCGNRVIIAGQQEEAKYDNGSSCVNTGYYCTSNLLAQECPEGYVEDAEGYCEVAPDCTNFTDTKDMMWVFNPDDPTLTSVPIYHSDGTCLYSADSSVIDDPDSCGVYERDGQPVAACKISVTGLGTEGTQADADVQNNGAGTSSFDEPENLTNKQTETKTDSGSTTYTTDGPTTNPDGSTTQSSTETTTNTSGGGQKIWYDDDNIYYRDSTGTTTVYERTKTETTNTDSTKTEVIDTSKTTTTPSSDTTVINKNSGNVTTTNNGDSTTYYDNSTTINNYDSNGNLTDSTTTSDSGTADEGNPEEEGNCGAPGQPSCEIKLQGEDNLSDPSGGFIEAETKLDLKTDYLESITDNDITGSLFSGNPFNMPSTNTCDPSAFSSEYHGQTFTPFHGFCSFYDDDVRPLLAFFFWMLTIFGCYLIWVRTMRGNT